MFHKHNWIKIETTYAPPVSNMFSVEGNWSETVEKLKFGLTTILWECSICQKIRKVEMLGGK